MEGGSRGLETVMCLFQSYNCSSHNVSNFKVCCNKWKHRGGKRVKSDDTPGLLTSVRFGDWVSVPPWPLLSHAVNRSWQNKTVQWHLISHTLFPYLLLIAVCFGDCHLTAFCTVICIFRALDQNGRKTYIRNPSVFKFVIHSLFPCFRYAWLSPWRHMKTSSAHPLFHWEWLVSIYTSAQSDMTLTKHWGASRVQSIYCPVHLISDICAHTYSSCRHLGKFRAAVKVRKQHVTSETQANAQESSL